MRPLSALAAAGTVAALLLIAAAPGARAQFGGFGGGGAPEMPPAVRSDIPYIKCSVCELFVKQAMRETKRLREEAAKKPGKHLEEGDLMEALEKLCKPFSPEGEWIRRLDMVEEGDAIKLEDMGKAGKPTSETATIARACAAVSDDTDLSDLSEALFLGKSRSQLNQLVCYDTTDACRKKAPPVPEDRPDGPEFGAASPEETPKDELMAKLKEAGLSGQMFDKESLKGMAGAAGGGDGDEEDDSAEL